MCSLEHGHSESLKMLSYYVKKNVTVLLPNIQWNVGAQKFQDD